MINVNGLMMELGKAGIAVSGCNTNGKVWDMSGNEIQTRPDVAAVIVAHDGSVWDARVVSWDTKRSTARTAAKDVPGWATWTLAQFNSWCDANLMSDAAIDATTLSAALKTNIKALNAFCRNAGKMIIDVRDYGWGDLADYASGVIDYGSRK